MLDVEVCRGFLGSAHQLSDEEVEALRSQLYALAALALDAVEGRSQPPAAEGGSE